MLHKLAIAACDFVFWLLVCTVFFYMVRLAVLWIIIDRTGYIYGAVAVAAAMFAVGGLRTAAKQFE